MARRIQLHSGRILEFGDNWNDEQIDNYILQNFDATELVEDVGMLRGAADFAAQGGAALLDAIGGAADLAVTDRAAPLYAEDTMRGRIERSMRDIPFLGEAMNTGARAVEVGENTLSALGRSGAGLIDEYGPDALKPLAAGARFAAGEIQQGQLDRRAAENAARAARGEQSLEDETRGTFAQAFADQARGMADDARGALSDESKVEQMQLAGSFDQGIGTGLKYALTNPFDTFTAIGPEVAAFMVGGGIAGRGAKALGATDEFATALSLQGQGAAAAELNASGAADVVRSLTDERIAELPMGQSLLQQGMSVDQAREEMARRAYDAAFGFSAPTNVALMGLTQKLNLNPVETAVVGGKGFGNRVAAMEGLTGRAARATTAGTAEGTGEFVEEAADQLGQNVGEIAGGTREGKDVLEGTATAGVMGALAGTAMGGTLGLMTGPDLTRRVAEERTSLPTDLTRPAEQGEQDARAIYEAMQRGESLPGPDARPLPGVQPDPLPTAPAAQGEPLAAPQAQPATPAAPQPGAAPTRSLMQPADELEQQLADAGAAPIILPQDGAAPAMRQSRAWQQPEQQDAPNFGMPEVTRTLPDDSPLLVRRENDNSPERVAMREALIQQRLAGRPSVPPGQRPVAYVMGGGGASGKGIVLKLLEQAGEVNPQSFAYIDPDSFKTGDEELGFSGIPEYQQMIEAGDKRAADIVHKESSNVAKETVRRAVANRQNIVLDRTLGGGQKAVAELEALKDAGYEIKLVGVTVDPREAINRSAERAAGPKGRYVPLRDLLQAHKGFSGWFDKIQAVADSVRLFDNNVPKGADPILIADREDGESGLSLYDELRYNNFVKKASLNDSANTYREIGYEASSPDAGADQGAGGQARPEQLAGQDGRGAEERRLGAGDQGSRGAGEPASGRLDAQPGEVSQQPKARQSRADDQRDETGPQAEAQPEAAPAERAPDPQITKAIKAVMRALGIPDRGIVIARSPRDLWPDEVIEALEIDNLTEGLYLDGQAYVFTDNIRSPARGIWVALHEHSGHHGLQTLLGDRYAQVMNYAATNPLVKAIAADMKVEADAEAQAGAKGARKNADPNEFTEEAIVEIQAALLTGDVDALVARYPSVKEAMTKSAPGLISRIVSAIKAALGKAGAPAMTNAELGQLLADARRMARAKPSPADVTMGDTVSRGPARQSRPAGPAPDLPRLMLGDGAPPKDKPVVLMFGGSFNPVHNGHVQSALNARQQLLDAGYNVERVVVSPSGRKLLEAKLGPDAMSVEDRAEIARLSFEGFEGFEVADGPANEADNFTGKLKRTMLADWAQREYPNATVINLTGEDAAPGSPPGFPSVYEGDAGTSHEGYYYLAVPRDEGESGLSSSKVRKAIKEGKGVPAGFMNEAAEARYLQMMGAAPRARQSRAEGSANVTAIMAGDERTPKLKGKTEVAQFLQDRAIAKRGRVLDIANEADRDLVASDMVEEAIFELENSDSAVEWYDDTIKKTMATLALKYPEIDTDPDARTAFTIALAVTSQNMAIPNNLAAAEEVYGKFREGGRFPVAGYGSKGGSMKKNFQLANKLLEKLGSMERLREFLATPMTVRQINALGYKKVGGELLDADVLGSSVFGPKIGFGFYTNLTGNFAPVTMDMWFMRTVGRLTGKLMAYDPAKFEKQLAKLRDALGKPEEGSAALIKEAYRLAAAHEKDFKVNRALYDSGERKKSAATNAAINVVKSLKDARDAPSSGEERRLLRDIVDRALAKMKERTGRDVPAAAFQALIWYPEQDLYKQLGVKLKHVRQDYAKAAKQFLIKEGFNEADIDAAAARATGRGDDRTRPGAGDARPADGVEVGSGTGPDGGPAGQRVQQPQQARQSRAAGRDGGGRDEGRGLAPLPGAPRVEGATGPDERLAAVAESYARERGIPFGRQAEYVEVDVERARRIADAYERMPHAPQDPAVRRAYADLIEQTVAQYRALEQAGYKFWLFDDGNDPYAGNPWNAMRDLRANQSMGVYATEAGYGNTDAALDEAENPLLADTGIRWPFGSPTGPLKRVLANDLFRAVHDAFGHGLEGAGFRGRGEENAWQAHSILFTGDALRALATETRGQNSWLNYGPFGEQNQTASVEETVFAQQKIGLIDAWVSTEGRAGFVPMRQSRAPSATSAARATARALRERKSQLARELTQQSVTVEQLKVWANKARLLIGEVGASRDFAQEIADAKRELTAERRDTLAGDRAALKRYDEVRDMIGMLESDSRQVRGKVVEASRLIDKLERRESQMSLNEREALLQQLGDALDVAERAYIAAKSIADWRAKNDANIVKAKKKRNEALNYLAAEGYQQGSMPWGTGSLLDKKDKLLRKIRRLFQDRLIDLRDVQEQIERDIGRAIDDMQNVYRAENQMHGKTADAIQGFHEKMRDPLIKLINDTGLSLQSVERYLWAKHATERNNRIASIRPGVNDGAGMTNDEASAIIASFTPEQIRKLDAVSRKVQDVRKFTLQTMVQSGQIDQESMDRMLKAYSDYVPLRGKDGDGDERIGQTRGTGQGISAGGTGIVRAMGRKTAPKNILAELVGDAERSIVQAGKAEVGRALLRMALSYPNPEIWEVQPVELKPTFNETTGEVYLAVTSTAQQNAESIIVKHNGKPYRVAIKHPQLRDALRNTGVEGAEWFVRYFGMLNRWLSAVFTRFNPGFVPINLMRDLTLGLTGVGVELGAESAGKVTALYMSSFGASYRQARLQRGSASVPDSQKTMDDWAREAAEAGMKSGWTALDDMDTLQRDIENSMAGVGMIAKTGVSGIDFASEKAKQLKDLGREAFRWVDNVNDGVENGLRLATYIHLRRDKGWSKDKAAEYAKELTVNFNRKGMAGSIINSMYLFYNAAVQGSRRTLQIMKHPKTMGVLGAIGASQFMLAVTLGSAKFGDDEDDDTLWEKIPDHVKRRSFVIPTGFGDDGAAKYIAIPMPFGFNAVPAVSGYAANFTNERWVAKQGGAMALAGNAIGYTMSTVIDALSPIAVGEEDAFWPTLVQMGMQLAANRDSLGRTIGLSDAFTPYETPRAEMYTAGTFTGYVWAARALNRLGFGDQYNPPRVMAGLLDVSPNDLEFLVGQLLGGPGNIANQTWRMGALIVAGEEVKTSDIPIVRTIVGEQRVETSEVRAFYDNKDNIERNLDRLKDAFVEGGADAFYAKRAELGPMFAEVDLKIRKETTENGVAGDFFRNPRTGAPTLVATEGSLVEEYRDARKALSDLNAEMRRVYNDRSLTSAQRQAEIMRINREKGAAVENVNRMANYLTRIGIEP